METGRRLRQKRWGRETMVSSHTRQHTEAALGRGLISPPGIASREHDLLTTYSNVTSNGYAWRSASDRSMVVSFAHLASRGVTSILSHHAARCFSPQVESALNLTIPWRTIVTEWW